MLHPYLSSILPGIPRDLEIFLCFHFSPYFSFHFFGMVEIVEWPFKKMTVLKMKATQTRKKRKYSVEIVQWLKHKPLL